MRVEPELHDAEIDLGEEEAGDLLDLCHLWMETMIERRMPKDLEREGRRLLALLDQAQSYYTVH